jgi:hypothetical protein
LRELGYAESRNIVIGAKCHLGQLTASLGGNRVAEGRGRASSLGWERRTSFDEALNNFLGSYERNRL